jgi:hypothetical protein
VATVGVVKAIITADTTQLKKGMTDAQRSMDRLGKQMSKVGKSMTMKVTMPLVGVGVAAAKMASDFEFSMTQIETLVGRSAKEVDTLKGAVLGLSGETGRAPKELADAMFFITSAGLDASSATAALEASAKAAAVGLGDTVIVADAVTNAMNGYGMSAQTGRRSPPTSSPRPSSRARRPLLTSHRSSVASSRWQPSWVSRSIRSVAGWRS